MLTCLAVGATIMALPFIYLTICACAELALPARRSTMGETWPDLIMWICTFTLAASLVCAAAVYLWHQVIK